jgi:hypothetical protein
VALTTSENLVLILVDIDLLRLFSSPVVSFLASTYFMVKPFFYNDVLCRMEDRGERRQKRGFFFGGKLLSLRVVCLFTTQTRSKNRPTVEKKKNGGRASSTL